MKPGDNLNNLSQVPCRSPLDSTTENNSFSSDSDLEVLGGGAADQKRIIQGLKRTIKRNQTKINDLTSKLTVADIHLASEREKTKDKEDVIKALKLSIDLNTQIKDLKLTLDSSKTLNVTQDSSGQRLKDIESGQYKTKIDELNADIEILESKLKNKNDKLSELDDKTKQYESDLREKDVQIAELESQAKSYLETTQKYESDLKEKDEHIANLESQIETDAAKIKEIEDKLSKFTLKAETSQDNSDSLVLLNCTKIPSIQIVTLPDVDPFAAVFEDLPSAGHGWMVIQRRIDGSVEFHTRKDERDFDSGFGDLSKEFWLGCEKLHKLTTSRRHELYIELVDFDNATAFARYDNFVVGKATDYVLQFLGDYSGNAGDYLRKCEKCSFRVAKYDICNKRDSYGWWMDAECNLNGKYYDHKTEITEKFTNSGIWWGRWNLGRRYALKSCKMLIRPKP